MVSAVLASTKKLGQWTLPLFLTPQNKYKMALVCTVIVSLVYLVPNHLPIYEPATLRFSWIDHAVPFVPNTFWIYMSEFLMYIVAYTLAKDLRNANQFIYAFIGLFSICSVIFLFFPTTFPRQDYPLPESLNTFTYKSFYFFRLLDRPTNCLPSLHVASTYLTSFIFLNEQKEKFKYFFIWATLIAISTLTTKQHYFIDVVAGFFTAIVIYFIFYRLVPYRSKPH